MQEPQRSKQPGDTFPSELTSRKQWLVWRFVNKPGQKKPSKMPYYATTGNLRGWPNGKPKDGEATEEQPQVDQGHQLDRENLTDYPTAVMQAARLGFDGVGFAFLPGDGLIGIDLDIHDDPEKQTRASTILAACNSWAETSPSGKGMHIIVSGETETFKHNGIGIEVFCGRQFFTMTGNHIAGSPETINPIAPDVLAKLQRTVQAAKDADRAAKEAEAAARDPAPIPAGPAPAPSNSEASRYCLAALESAVQRLRSAQEGGRNDLLNGEAYGLAQLIHTGGISESTIRGALQDAAMVCGLTASEAKATINSGIRAGVASPRAIPAREHPARPPRPAAPATAPRVDPETGEILDPPANDNQRPAPSMFAKPMDIFAEFPAPAIEAAMLPDAIYEYAAECGELIGVDPAMVAIPALVSCAAALHDDVRIQPKRHETGWTESARLWCAIVGAPSVKKSPSIRRATRRLRKIDADMAEENARLAADHADQLEQYKDAKREAKKSGTPIGQAPERPPMSRMVVEDITIEALSEVLKDNSRGVLCIQDELSGWFGSMDAYTGGKSGNKDRAAWLQAYNGGFRQVDRVMRGVVHIPNFSVSMIGGIQPDAIRRIAKDMTDDGLMQRFMIVIGRNAPELDRPEDEHIHRNFSRLVDHLHAVVGGRNVVTLSEDAHVIRERLNAYAAELADYPALPGGLRSHLGKWSGLFARLLLVYHAIECSGQSVHPANRPVSWECAARVELLMRRFLLPHALAYYTDILGGSGELEHARWIAGFILSRKLAEVTNRDLIQSYKQWRGMDDWRRQRVMQVLEDMGWVIPLIEEGRTSKRWATSWLVNPEVHTLFTTKAAEETERRTRLREEIAEIQKRGRQ